MLPLKGYSQHSSRTLVITRLFIVVSLVAGTEVLCFYLPQSSKCRVDYNNLPSSVHLDLGCNHVTCGSSCGSPCPESRDCQQNGLIVCKVLNMTVPFECGYDQENCYIFHKVSGCTNGGSVSVDGTCVCPPGYMGQFCHQYVHTCHDIYLRDPNSASGEYSLLTHQDATITVWCSFRDNVIMTFISKASITSLTTEELSPHYSTNSAVDVIVKWSNGSQTESTLEQITSFSSTPLGIMANEYVQYTAPSKPNLGPYLYLGFLPRSMAPEGVTQGYRANGVDRSFYNCDSNPSSKFIFYSNPAALAGSSNQNLFANSVMSHWASNSRNVASGDHLPDHYFLDTEVSFGGCGCLGVSYNWAEVDGLALGLKYSCIQLSAQCEQAFRRITQSGGRLLFQTSFLRIVTGFLHGGDKEETG